MKFVMAVEHVGTVAQLDDLAQNLGYKKDEIGFLSDSQDVEHLCEFFGRMGKTNDVQEFDSWWVVARDGDYEAMWACHGIAYTGKPLYQIKWRLVDAIEWRYLQKHFRDSSCRLCGGGAIDHTRKKLDPNKPDELRLIKKYWRYRIICLNTHASVEE
jgi:hypothetical protein